MTKPPDQRSSGNSTSRSLLNAARLADAAAWERLVKLYTPLVASWCRRWGVSKQDTVDVLQDVFYSVAAHLGRFRKDRLGDSFRGWLMVIARNKAMDHFNNRNREPVAAGGTEASMRLREFRDPVEKIRLESELPTADEEVVFNDVLLRALESIKSEFHDRTWQAFWKVVVEGRCTNDVAADLSMKPGAVRVSKSRVLLRLRHELGDLGE